ncbi:RFWD1 [Mytilus edulis]|uniref:TRAF7 n=1 Tax=Mytilus edulis TaxID=6550 RepID=A0A8S3UYF0_MYTED|nr:RFWD1 [Mytilus edulis]
MKNRPLDEQLCKQYYIHLSDVNKRFEEIGDTLQEMNTSMQGISTIVNGMNTTLQGIGWNLHGMDGSVQKVNTTLQGLERSIQGGSATLQEMNSSIQTINIAVQGIPVMNDAIQKLVYYAENGGSHTCQRQTPDIQRQERETYKLGQDIFYQHHQFNIENICKYDKAVITDDGQIVCIILTKSSMGIYNTDGSHVGSIQLQGWPFDITVINNSVVAVILFFYQGIEIWDIRNKQRVKSIQLSSPCLSITTTNNKLVAGCRKRLLIIDPQTEKVEKTIDIGDCIPNTLCGLVMVYFTQMIIIITCTIAGTLITGFPK